MSINVDIVRIYHITLIVIIMHGQIYLNYIINHTCCFLSDLVYDRRNSKLYKYSYICKIIFSLQVKQKVIFSLFFYLNLKKKFKSYKN